ncbi:MAG: hypothetical protein ACI84C_000288 [Flavobacteriales bacterium]|jgi:hypothetical protein
MLKKVVVIMCIIALIASCKKDDPVNPYDDIVRVLNDNPEADDLPVGNFAWLQAKVFGPTCANSGCHDGTFEPAFSTITSSYNTLVNHPVITNDDNGTFTYRVVPGDAENSLLHERLTTFIPNTSGIMPLEWDPDSDWPENEDFYISQVAIWIDAGAKNMYGQAPNSSSLDFPPSAEGLVVFPSGNTTTPYPRNEDGVGITPILVEAAEIDIWIRVTDDITALDDFPAAFVKLAADLGGFPTEVTHDLIYSSPLTALDFTNQDALFYYKATVDLTGASSGQTFFLRAYLDDGEQTDITEIPNDGSSNVINALFLLSVQ